MLRIVRSTIEYGKIYMYGVVMSSAFVLCVNDIFYQVVFKKKEEENTSIWEELKPREIFGVGAKTTFLKHVIDSDKGDESSEYHTYIENRKDDDKTKDLKGNIFENKRI